MPRPRNSANPFRYFNSSPEVIRLVVMMYVRFPLSLRNVEELLFERGINICHETARLWWNRFGPMFVGDIRRQHVSRMKGFRHWRRHLDEMYVKLNGEMVYLWRAVDHEGEILESYVTRKRDKTAALVLMKKALKRHGSAETIVTDGLRSYPAAMRELGNLDHREMGRWLNNRAENSHLPFRRRERAMLRFRQMKSLQKFASVHANVHNHFNLERHQIDRDQQGPPLGRISRVAEPYDLSSRWEGEKSTNRRRVAIGLTPPQQSICNRARITPIVSSLGIAPRDERRRL